jgi:prevent-host-death family protein
MSEVTVLELRNHGEEVLERVSRGESLTVTQDGEAIAELL